ncbi:uncharacterized protein F5891DRAFT_1172088 [Suillus fuscotomentosus]|uniref:Uncharacterized protein n=1 Tax=Suillus fuscotomentosus TaxID=1912939 RepID=A0AAD4EA36_9AGAM|nr:uncharacterized protein F5891DRAFT_1172088 [Suillus fuscotomentosus]KAG1902377.1 hypothetical protein F5891DRAFT_1172088 [Suillus fuscotomentosus]
METPDWVDTSSKMHSFKKLASMWQSDFHLNSVLKKQQLLALVANHGFGGPVALMAGDSSRRYGHFCNKGHTVRVGTQYRAPESGQRLEELPAGGSFYVHIRDFNRAIPRLEHSNNVYNCNSPGRLIRRLGRLAQMCFTQGDGDIITNHSYTVAVCPTGSTYFALAWMFYMGQSTQPRAAADKGNAVSPQDEYLILSIEQVAETAETPRIGIGNLPALEPVVSLTERGGFSVVVGDKACGITE